MPDLVTIRIEARKPTVSLRTDEVRASHSKGLIISLAQADAPIISAKHVEAI